MFVETELGPLTLGESIAVMGVCLTVDRILGNGFEADMSEETLRRTTLGSLPVGSAVHLERATPAGGRLGGHIVAGHVDAVGAVEIVEPRGEGLNLRVSLPDSLAHFVAEKGSIAIDGVSLTVNEVRGGRGAPCSFDVMLVPHTQDRTRLPSLRPSDRVNIEVDLLARYVARWLDLRPETRDTTKLDAPHDDERLLDKLRKAGFA